MHRITTIDVHVAGEPLRVITSGFPEPPGNSILEKRRMCQDQSDHIRRALMWEPRGHPDMYGCLVVSPSLSEADCGVLFFHNEGYSTMCGHGIIGLVTVLLENAMIPCTEPETTVRLETPSGLVTAKASIRNGRVRWVAFRNVPSFVVDLDQRLEVPGVGVVPYDLAFGGAFYAFCQAEALGIELTPEQSRRLVDLAMTIKQAITAHRPISHPVEPELGFLYGTIFVGPASGSGVYRRHVCVFADGALDRSPTGTGVSAHLALLNSRGLVAPGEPLEFESILGTRFTGRVVEQMEFAGHPAIIPEIGGCAYLTGRQEFFIDPDDPLKDGFLLR